MKTKTQKHKIIEESLSALQKSETVILVDFTGLSVNKMNAFRRLLSEAGANLKVIKKRLLKIIFDKLSIGFDAKQFESQVGTIFSSKKVEELAEIVYRFLKERKEGLKILGGFEIKEKKFINASVITQIGQLPSREILLVQLVRVLAAPIRKFLFVLNENAKKRS